MDAPRRKGHGTDSDQLGMGEIENDDDNGRSVGNADSRFALGDYLFSNRDGNAALTPEFLVHQGLKPKVAS
jgi:hypothetical protein